MALETASFINQLVPANPPGSDRVHQGDDHIRLLKAVLKNTFPNITGPVTLSQDQLNSVFSGSVPVGFFGLWYGAADAIPGGWALCDGTTVNRSDGEGTITTPDMRGVVPAGLKSPQTVGQKFGAEKVTGLTTNAAGAHGHTGTTNSAGEHNHGGSTGSLTAEGTLSLTKTNVDGGGGDPVKSVVQAASFSGQAHSHSINSQGAHQHTVTIQGAGDHNHTVGDISVVQPSIAFHFIMKV